MRVCLMVEGQEGVSWDQWLALASACEESGIEGLFRSDHYLSVFGRTDRGALDAWATIAALGTVTRRIRLGTLVSPATFRHPSVLARNAVTVDHVSNGRVELGIGGGWHEQEHRQHGFEFGDVKWRLELFAEQLEIVHRQLNEDEPFDFRGRHFTLEGCNARPKPVQRPLPILVGGSAKSGTARPAVRFASEYNTTFASPEECRERRRRLDRFCEEAGRDPATLPLSVMTTCVVGRDRAELERRVRRIGEITGRTPAPNGYVVGTVDEVVARLRELESAGVVRIMLQHLAHEDVEMVELLGREVAPAVS
jgi:alkanesulfonate monooxygenase SsuD/methylene tetrahydromethanopterin reductase-like flavin-dependent oxidoreductase (luciferase family)